MGFFNVLEFVSDYNAQVSVCCTVDDAGEVVILSDKGRILAFLNNENKLLLTGDILNSEEQRTVDIFQKRMLSFADIKRAFIACFNGGPCIALKDGRAVLRTLKNPSGMMGRKLPKYRPLVRR